MIISELFGSLKFRCHKLNSVEIVAISVYPYIPSFLLVGVAHISGCVGHIKQHWLWSIQMCQLTKWWSKLAHFSLRLWTSVCYDFSILCFNIILLLTIILLAVAIWLDGSHMYLVIPVPNAPRTGPFVSIMRVVSSLILFL